MIKASPSTKLALVLFWHFACLVRCFSTDGAVAELVSDHRVVGGAGATELPFFYDIADVDHGKCQDEKGKYGEKYF